MARCISVGLVTDNQRLIQRLSKIGISKWFLQRYVLPDWWSDEVDQDGAGFAEMCGYIYVELGIKTARLMDHKDPLNDVFSEKEHKRLLSGWGPVTKTQRHLNLSLTLHVSV